MQAEPVCRNCSVHCVRMTISWKTSIKTDFLICLSQYSIDMLMYIYVQTLKLLLLYAACLGGIDAYGRKWLQFNLKKKKNNNTSTTNQIEF